MDSERQLDRIAVDGPALGPRPYLQRAMAALWGEERVRVRGARAGRALDFEALFRRHWPLAYRAAFLVVHDAAAAEDIAQESFLAALRNLDRFDRRRPFGPWLHRIVVNRAIDWTRSRKLRAEVELGDHLAAPPAADPDGRAFGRIADLAPEHRAV